MSLTPDLKQELMDSFEDLYDEVEICLNRLQGNQCSEQVNSLFRAMHTIKGNAGIFQISPIVDFAHTLEEVASSIRKNSYLPSAAVCDAIRLGMDRLRDIHERELVGKQYNQLMEDELMAMFHKLSESTQDTAEICSNDIINLVSHGVLPNSGCSHRPTKIDSSDITLKKGVHHDDLFFFQELAFKTDQQHSYWKGRSNQIFEWAHRVNEIGGTIVDFNQLSAAIFLHDVGMSFLPHSFYEKANKNLNEKEIQVLRSHPTWGHELISRIPGWEEAAIIILQHHECVDGSGYPQGLKHHEIHPGARLLSIIDSFFLEIKGRAEKSQRKSIVQAVSSINAMVDSKFDGMWVQCFNQMIRRELHAGNL